MARIDAMTDEDIDYSDIPPLGDEFFDKPTVEFPPTKRSLTIHLDADIWMWLQEAGGSGYENRINQLLRIAMESQEVID